MATSKTRIGLLIVGALAVIALGYRFTGGGQDSGDTARPGPVADRQLSNQPTARGARNARTQPEHVQVRGTVLDVHSGQGVNGIVIALAPAGSGTAADATPVASAPASDERGRYQLSVAPGRYRVRLMGAAIAAQPGQILTLASARDPYLIDIQVVRMAQVTGRVVDPAGEPLAGVSVGYRASPAEEPGAPRSYSDRIAATATSDRDGGFQLLVPPGRVALYGDLVGWPESHTSLRWVEPGAELTGVELVMDDGVVLAGLVVDALDTPIADATIHGRADEQYLDRQTTSGDDGRFELIAMRPGRLTVWASASGRASSSPAVVELRPGDRKDDLRLVLPAPSEIHGVVIDDTGHPRAEMTVRAESAAIPGPQAETHTDSAGAFQLTGLAEAPYVLIAEGPGVASAYHAGVMAPARAVEIVVSRTGTVAGRVTDEHAQPLADFWVRMDRRARPDAQAGESMIPFVGENQRVLATDGTYLIDRVRPGRYDVTFWATGFAANTLTGIEVPAGGEAEADASLVHGGTVVGTVTDADSKRPIRGAAIRLSTGSEYPTVYSDAAGAFAIPDIALGRRSLEVSHPSYIGRIATGIEVVHGDSRPIDIALERLAFGSERTVEFAGIGAVLAMEEGLLRVRDVIPHGPSEVAGLRAGDGITHTDGIATGERTMAENIESIRGVVGTVVRVTVLRGQQRFNRDIVRASIRFKPGDVGSGDEAPEPAP